MLEHEHAVIIRGHDYSSLVGNESHNLNPRSFKAPIEQKTCRACQSSAFSIKINIKKGTSEVDQQQKRCLQQGHP